MACSVLINKWTIECDIPGSEAYVSSNKYHGIISMKNKILLKVYDTSLLDNENNFEINELDPDCFIKVDFNKKIIRVIYKDIKKTN